jgi:hypothetical protein
VESRFLVKNFLTTCVSGMGYTVYFLNVVFRTCMTWESQKTRLQELLKVGHTAFQFFTSKYKALLDRGCASFAMYLALDIVNCV